MEPLQHDPRTKQQIKDALYEFLYTPVLQKYRERLDSIIIKNAVLLSSTHHSFTYKGVLYACEGQTIPRKLNRLVPPLRPHMEEYLAEVNQLNNKELPYVLGFITKMLNASNSLQDYLQILPDCVHKPIVTMIAQCPCKAHGLTPDQVNSIKEANKDNISLLKQRLITNLII